MKKIGICGHFAQGKDFFDGQTVKTKILTRFGTLYFRVLIHNTPCASINQVYFVNKLFAIAFVLCYN